MPNAEKASTRSSDCLESIAGTRQFDVSANAWLIGQGVLYLNSTGKEGELAYQHVVELLRRCSEEGEILETVQGLFRQASSGDAPLRWSLLYILGDVGNATTADFLVYTALKHLPEVEQNKGCEGPRDVELLVSTMAVHALQRIVVRHPEVSAKLLEIVSERPARPILIEAVKVANDLGLKSKVQELLPKEDRWILKIRRVRPKDLLVEPEREEGKERGFAPPRIGLEFTSPHVACCQRRSG